MQTISELKEQAVTDTPLLVFDCALSTARRNGGARTRYRGRRNLPGREFFSTAHSDIQTASDQGIDGSPRISVVLANADSHFSEIERAIGWKARG